MAAHMYREAGYMAYELSHDQVVFIVKCTTRVSFGGGGGGGGKRGHLLPLGS